MYSGKCHTLNFQDPVTEVHCLVQLWCAPSARYTTLVFCAVSNRCTSQPRFFQLFLYTISKEGKHKFYTNVNREYRMIHLGRWENLDFCYSKVVANTLIYRIHQNLWMAHWIRFCFDYVRVKRIDVYIVNLFTFLFNTM